MTTQKFGFSIKVAKVDFETVIGLEVHAQLLTQSKMFCGCAAEYAKAPPNTRVCPVCLGMPGVLPVINKKAIEYTIMTALALNCTISEYTRFDRKNYPYPDLMKGYQISQYDNPIGRNGWIMIEVEGERHRVGIRRVHLEEDVAKLVHRTDAWGESYSLLDINRSGVPLMEIVTEPDLHSPEEARQFLIKLRAILQYLGVSTGNMEEGSFRCDANISIRPRDGESGFPKVEVKNMNSFKAVYRALEYEARRQRKVIEEGGQLAQETRGWVEEKGMTVAQRSKEYAHDYRYFPEPDLPPLAIDAAWVEEIRSRLPELPERRRDRFVAQYGLPLYDANLLTSSKAMADYFEACLRAGSPHPEKKAKMVSNWLLGDFSRLLNLTGEEISDSKVSPPALMELLNLLEQGTISGSAAKTVFEEMFYTGKRAGEIVAEKGLTQISDVAAVEEIVQQVILNNAAAVADYKSGKEQALTFLVGQVMRATRGRANPRLVHEVLRRELARKAEDGIS
jgi:aspartyl-tRNA(Asn)/glutamyl-tRNA(Gln) amidotransferase subunit B